MKIKKLLIANRGEIAVRILRSCRDLGISTVAIYSDCDKTAPHLLFADEVHAIGGKTAAESYLNIDKILTAAKQSGANAIHPGYGFLAENAEFAQQCAAANVLFIGPDAKVIAAMGDKLNSRELAQQAGLPVIPGSPRLDKDSAAKPYLQKLGFPLLVKCSAGGGGHGMRLVRQQQDFAQAIKLTRAEGISAFGDGAVYLEKALQNPQHIEVQIFGCSNGQAVHLFSRACSLQRRFQKIVEEAPAPSVADKTLIAMQADAVKLATHIGYTGAGTVEFLVDEQGRYYFLEMNTRLQVEHTVTEMVLGIDLVALQIEFAAGNRLTSRIIELLKSNNRQPQPRGHAIECRLYAEDPLNDFMPSPGKVIKARLPSGPGVRVDSGIVSGTEVPHFYDPIMAKIITWGEDREQARCRMLRALQETTVVGTHTNLNFLQTVLESEEFKRGDYRTTTIESAQMVKQLQRKIAGLEPIALCAAAVGFLESSQTTVASGEPLSPWQLDLRTKENP